MSIEDALPFQYIGSFSMPFLIEMLRNEKAKEKGRKKLHNAERSK